MSSRSLRLSWKLPLGFNERHGTVVHYPIQCISEENPEHIINIYNPRDMREVELDRLIPYNTYNCCVSVQTTLANSSVVCQAARTPEEGRDSDQPNRTKLLPSLHNIGHTILIYRSLILLL